MGLAVLLASIGVNMKVVGEHCHHIALLNIKAICCLSPYTYTDVISLAVVACAAVDGHAESGDGARLSVGVDGSFFCGCYRITANGCYDTRHMVFPFCPSLGACAFCSVIILRQPFGCCFFWTGNSDVPFLKDPDTVDGHVP